MGNRRFVIAALLLIQYAYATEPLRMYIFYTPSHQQLRDEWFFPSLKDTDIEVVEEYYEQECSGHYMADNWVIVMQHKIDLILRAIKENWGGLFIHADVDIQFFEPIREQLLFLIGDKDMLFQKDVPQGNVCAGFFISRANERTLKLWKAVKEVVLKRGKSTNDQWVLNDLIKKSNPFGIAWDYLPDRFFGGGTCSGVRWKPGDDLSVPEDIVLHHANWTVGVGNKIDQLKTVRDIVVARAFVSEMREKIEGKKLPLIGCLKTLGDKF